jgi:hypothetical protein
VSKNLVLQESFISTSPDFSPGTPYIGFFETYINESGSIMVIASIDDPNIASTVDRALVRIDNPLGVFTETVLAKEGDELLPGRFVSDFGTAPHTASFNNNGDFMYYVDLDGDSTTDDTIWINNTLLVQEEDPSPIAGRTYASLSSPELELNDSGEYVFSASLSGDTNSNLVLIKNGAVYRQEGDPITVSTGTFVIEDFGTGPLEIDNSGNVVWLAEWDDANTDQDKGLFWNDTLIAQEGVTTIDIDGNDFVINTLRDVQDGYSLSDDGTWMIFRAVLEDNIDVACLVEFPTLTGACCDFTTYGCSIETRDDCLNQGGAYQGDGTLCDPSPCFCFGDMDCDGDVDFDDISGFVVAIGDDGTAWMAWYMANVGGTPPCDFLNADGDNDGDCDFDDITPFVNAIPTDCTMQ